MGNMIFIVDPQCDFINGKLPIAGAKVAMDNLAAYLEKNNGKYTAKIVTLDRHPYEHCSFIPNGGPWPRHCVNNSVGCAIWPTLISPIHETAGKVYMFYKGEDVGKDEYSVFMNQDNLNTIKSIVKDNHIDKIDICGLAGDICVLNTLKDGISIFGHSMFNVLKEYAPSLDGGTALECFCQKDKQCAR